VRPGRAPVLRTRAEHRALLLPRAHEGHVRRCVCVTYMCMFLRA
jgi:hypothetical protein